MEKRPKKPPKSNFWDEIDGKTMEKGKIKESNTKKIPILGRKPTEKRRKKPQLGVRTAGGKPWSSGRAGIPGIHLDHEGLVAHPADLGEVAELLLHQRRLEGHEHGEREDAVVPELVQAPQPHAENLGKASGNAGNAGNSGSR